MSEVPDFAIEIHAKVLAARFKDKAQEEAELHAKMLKRAGDKKGHEVWMRVAKQIKQMRKIEKQERKAEKKGIKKRQVVAGEKITEMVSFLLYHASYVSASGRCFPMNN